MNTQTSICNLALAHLGMQPLTDLTTDLAANHPSAKACNTYWEPARDDCFREHRWTWCTVQEQMVTLGMTVVGWDYVYTYPSSAAIIWNVYNEGTVEEKETLEFEEIYINTLNCTAICTDQDIAYCDYSYIVTDVTKWDHKFVEAFSYKLAAKMAHLLVGDPQIGIAMGQMYSAIVSEAKRIGANQKRKVPYQTNSYLDARG